MILRLLAAKIKLSKSKYNYIFLIMTHSLCLKISNFLTKFVIYRFKIIVSLFFIMGVSWVTEMITFALNVPFEITVVPDILNILTGVYVFIIFVWKPSVWNLLKKKFPFLKHLNAISNIFNCKLMRRNLNIRQNKSPGDERNNSQSSSGFSNDSTQSSNVRSYPNSQSSAL